MAFETPPFAMDGTTEDAEQFRRAIGTLIGSAGGIVTAGDCAVAQQSTPNMSVQIAPGQVWVPGTSTTSQGPYYSRNGAATTVTISASSPSNPRVDTIIAQVQDLAYAGSLKQIAPAVVIGTPTAGANVTPGSGGYHAGAGAVPASSLILGYVLVPTSATSIVTANIENVVGPVVTRGGGEWSYTQIASPVTVSSTTEASGTAVISPAAFTPDGAPVLCEFFTPYLAPANVSGASLTVALFEGATQITRLAISQVDDTSTQRLFQSTYAAYRFTPTAAAHTYTVTAFESGGTANVGAGAGGTAAYPPAFVRFTKV